MRRPYERPAVVRTIEVGPLKKAIWFQLWRLNDMEGLRRFRREDGVDYGYAWDPRSLLFTARTWHCAGSEVFAERWGRALVKTGWRVSTTDIRGFRAMTDEQLWSYGAVVMGTGTASLIRDRLFGHGCYGPRLVGMINIAPSDADSGRLSDLSVINTDSELGGGQALREVVLHPLVYRFFDCHYARPQGRDAIVQVNLDRRRKNPGMFYALAEALPERRFIGIKGAYGEQVIRSLPNVEIRENHAQAVSLALTEAAVLICPSHAESYGMSVAEALSCGVPVVVSEAGAKWPNVKGLKEAAGFAGRYVLPDDQAGWINQVKAALCRSQQDMEDIRAWVTQASAREGRELVAVEKALKEVISERRG